MRRHRDDVSDRPYLHCLSAALRDLSGLAYPYLDVRGHHGASRNELIDSNESIASFHLGSFDYLATKLYSMREGESIVLGESCLLYLSNMWTGWNHDDFKLPVVLAGRLGGTLEAGARRAKLPMRTGA